MLILSFIQIDFYDHQLGCLWGAFWGGEEPVVVIIVIRTRGRGDGKWREAIKKGAFWEGAFTSTAAASPDFTGSEAELKVKLCDRSALVKSE